MCLRGYLLLQSYQSMKRNGFTFLRSKKANPLLKFKNNGFTLIELLVVILIIGVILGLVLTALDSTKKSARDQQRLRDLNSVKQALELYRSDRGEYPDSISFGYAFSFGGKTYMSKLPNDPLSDGRTYQYTKTGDTKFYLCATQEGSATYSTDITDNCGYCGAARCTMGITSD